MAILIFLVGPSTFIIAWSNTSQRSKAYDQYNADFAASGSNDGNHHLEKIHPEQGYDMNVAKRARIAQK